MLRSCIFSLLNNAVMLVGAVGKGIGELWVPSMSIYYMLAYLVSNFRKRHLTLHQVKPFACPHQHQKLILMRSHKDVVGLGSFSWIITRRSF